MSSILEADEEGVKLAASEIKAGRLVAFPTETVYGLGGNGLNGEAVLNIFKVKGRPSDNPLILHIANKNDVKLLASDIPEYVYELIDKFWPGPLTVVLKAKDIIPKEVRAGLDTVGIRFPVNKIARDIIKSSGVPIAAPSANISGRPSPTNFEDCYNDLKDKDISVVRGGSTDIGIESTVLLCTDYPPRILRPGKVTAEDIAKLIGACDDFMESEAVEEAPRSPGQKYGHYMAKKKTILLDMLPGLADEVLYKINPNATFILSRDNRFEDENKIVLAKYDDPLEASKRYFHALRKADNMPGELIVVQAYSKEGVGKALFNRMIKSASGNVMEDVDEDWIW
ncbi:MAG: L-threonylcarbamoyladenylate synthase [Ezakiella sp.]|nr:L-threonylcarbamoyladenylate synthase [Ezakiella sp.]